MTIVVGSVHSAGATTVALALAGWVERPLLVEADPDGGVLALRYAPRLRRTPGLLSLAAEAEEVDAETIMGHAQRLAPTTQPTRRSGRRSRRAPAGGDVPGVPVVVAPESPAQARYVLEAVGSRIAAALGRLDGLDVIVDIGRVSQASPALCLVAGARRVLVVARARREDLIAAAEQVAGLRAAGGAAGLVLVGAGPYGPADVESQLGCPVVGVIERDVAAADALAQGGAVRAVATSDLARSARELAGRLRRPVVEGAATAAFGTRLEVAR